jgi:hypothetical protein
MKRTIVAGICSIVTIGCSGEPAPVEEKFLKAQARTYCQRLLSEAPNEEIYNFIKDNVHSRQRGLENLTCGEVMALYSEKCSY